MISALKEGITHSDIAKNLSNSEKIDILYKEYAQRISAVGPLETVIEQDLKTSCVSESIFELLEFYPDHKSYSEKNTLTVLNKNIEQYNKLYIFLKLFLENPKLEKLDDTVYSKSYFHSYEELSESKCHLDPSEFETFRSMLQCNYLLKYNKVLICGYVENNIKFRRLELKDAINIAKTQLENLENLKKLEPIQKKILDTPQSVLNKPQKINKPNETNHDQEIFDSCMQSFLKGVPIIVENVSNLREINYTLLNDYIIAMSKIGVDLDQSLGLYYNWSPVENDPGIKNIVNNLFELGKKSIDQNYTLSESLEMNNISQDLKRNVYSIYVDMISRGKIPIVKEDYKLLNGTVFQSFEIDVIQNTVIKKANYRSLEQCISPAKDVFVISGNKEGDTIPFKIIHGKDITKDINYADIKTREFIYINGSIYINSKKVKLFESLKICGEIDKIFCNQINHIKNISDANFNFLKIYDINELLQDIFLETNDPSEKDYNQANKNIVKGIYSSRMIAYKRNICKVHPRYSMLRGAYFDFEGGLSFSYYENKLSLANNISGFRTMLHVEEENSIYFVKNKFDNNGVVFTVDKIMTLNKKDV